jgi:predicted nucleic acid-binding protein
MRRAVLADTGPLYAAVDRDDAYHGQAQEELGRLEHEGRRVVVAYSTLLESYTLILRRLGFNVVHTWLDDVLRGAALVNPTVDDCMAATARVAQYPDQPLTLFDTVLASISARLAWPVWTYDHHFDLLGTPVWR